MQTYAATLTANFASSTQAQPEDQLKAPVGTLLVAAGKAAGKAIVSRTESRVDGVAGRPDLGVDADSLPVGNVELKAPGNGARPDKFPDKRSRDQFERFKKLPNLIYTDGREWSLFRDGVMRGDVITLSNDPTKGGSAGVTLDDAKNLLELLGVFFRWDPVVPSSPRALAAMLAPLTRLLRDEVLADVRAGGVMEKLATEWRAVLFPDADDATFADGYAQTFTYALLLARLEGAPAPLNAENAAKELDADHALLAQALRMLGQAGTRDAIGMPVGLLERIISAVDAKRLSSGRDPWLYFYEDFLAAYDPEQRNNRGVYFTPYEVVSAQVRLCDWLLVEKFDKVEGFADPEVVALDPAAGTGTYPLTIAARALDAAVTRGGEGVRAEVATRLVSNLNAFELLVGPYAVTHLRLSRTFVDAGAAMPPDGVNVFLTDTLATPAHAGFAKQATLFQQKLASEQERASKVKDPNTHVTVVIGNPPYDRDESQSAQGVRRKGGMVRYDGNSDKPGLLVDFLKPLQDAGKGGQAKNLYNDYVYFWRWAIWKACEQATDSGIVSFITASSYLSGPGFAGMREVMRRRFDEIWLLDLGGEGRGTRREENVFEGVLTPVVIAFGVRLPDGKASTRADVPAVIRYRRVSGTRAEKLAVLNDLCDLDENDGWQEAPAGWGSPFIPLGTEAFDAWPLLFDVFPWQLSGTKAGRTWVIAPDGATLTRRWDTFLGETTESARRALFKDSPTGRKLLTPLRPGGIMPGTFPTNSIATATADDGAPTITRFGFRSFDRQYVIADPRMIDRPGNGWAVAGPQQVYLTTLSTNPLGVGPAVTGSACVPDLHHFRGSFGARDIIPMWRDADGLEPNVAAGVLAALADAYGHDVSAQDAVAYVFGLLGTGAYTSRFADELATSAARIPFTADPAVFETVAAFGRDLLWWATYGDRFQPAAAKGKKVRRRPPGTAKNTKAVSTAAALYPTEFSYDAPTKTIRVADGEFSPVEPAVWEFEVSGMKVVQSWLNYRMKKRAGKRSSPLDDIRPDAWTFSSEFVDLLAVVEHFVAAEDEAASLLDTILDGDLIGHTKFVAPSDAERATPTFNRATPTTPSLFN